MRRRGRMSRAGENALVPLGRVIGLINGAVGKGIIAHSGKRLGLDVYLQIKILTMSLVLERTDMTRVVGNLARHQNC